MTARIARLVAVEPPRDEDDAHILAPSITEILAPSITEFPTLVRFALMTLSESRQKKEDQRQAIAEIQTRASTMNDAIQATQYIAKQLESLLADCNAEYENSGMTPKSKKFKKTFPFATSRFEEKLQADAASSDFDGRDSPL
jgi:hypothetical protein